MLKVVCGLGKTWPLALQQLKGHDNYVLSVAFSPDGSKIVSGSSDKTIRVWDASTGVEMLPPLRGHDSWVESVAFSPDGSKIVSGSRDNTIRVWDASTGVEMLPPLRGHDDWVESVAFSPDGSKIVSRSHDKTIRIWDASTGVEIVLESDSRGVPIFNVWNVNADDFRPSVQMSTEGLSQSTMDKPTISLANGWFKNIHTGRYVGRLPAEHTYYRYEMCGFTFVGWTVDHKLVIIQLHAE